MQPLRRGTQIAHGGPSLAPEGSCRMMSRSALFALAVLLTRVTVAADALLPEPLSGAPSIAASYPVDGKPAAPIGKLVINGAGEVTFYADRSQTRLVIKAVDAHGAQIGRAETVVGIGDTPLYIRVTQGLYKIVVHWQL
jgi:hypothetical protein